MLQFRLIAQAEKRQQQQQRQVSPPTRLQHVQDKVTAEDKKRRCRLMSRARQVEKDARDESRVVQKKKFKRFLCQSLH